MQKNSRLTPTIQTEPKSRKTSRRPRDPSRRRRQRSRQGTAYVTARAIPRQSEEAPPHPQRRRGLTVQLALHRLGAFAARPPPPATHQRRARLVATRNQGESDPTAAACIMCLRVPQRRSRCRPLHRRWTRAPRPAWPGGDWVRPTAHTSSWGNGENRHGTNSHRAVSLTTAGR